MKRKQWLYILISFSLLIAIMRCTSIQLRDNIVEAPPVKIPPHPNRTVELVTLYFRSANGDFLTRETRAIERSLQSWEEAIIKELIRGPKGATLVPTISPQAKVYSVFTVDQTTYINFSREFATPMLGGDRAEATTIYSLVNTLTELRNVRRVQILIEGERQDIFQKHISLREPFSRNDRITREPLPNPIEVVTNYLNHIANEEYRWAFDQIYRPGDYDLDYAMFFHRMITRRNKPIAYEIETYRIAMEPGRARISIDYKEIFENNEIIQQNNREFNLINDMGEWKIIHEANYGID